MLAIKEYKYSHFDGVSEDVCVKLEQLAQAQSEYLSENYDYSEPRINEISGKSYSGFIAFTNGGYEVTSFYFGAWASGDYLTAKHETWTDEVRESFYQDYLKDNNLTELTDEQEEEYWDAESEYMSECNTFIRYESWVDGDSVFLRLSVGYKDTPYFRSKYDETIAEKTLTIQEFLAAPLESLTLKL